MRPIAYGVLALVALAGCELAAWNTTTRAARAVVRSLPPTPPPTPKPCRCTSACDPTGCLGNCCEPIPCVWRR